MAIIKPFPGTTINPPGVYGLTYEESLRWQLMEVLRKLEVIK